MPQEKKIAFIHVPKTAGTSVTRTLRLGWPRAKVVKNQEVFDAMADSEFADLDLVAGHFRAYSFEARNLIDFDALTILRDPFERLFSSYRFARAAVLERGVNGDKAMKLASEATFAEWVFSRFGPSQRHSQLYILGLNQGDATHKISLEQLLNQAQRRLDNIHVGTVDNINEFIRYLFQFYRRDGFIAVPQTNVTNRFDHGLTSGQMSELMELLRPDYELFSYGRDKMLRRIDGFVSLSSGKSKYVRTAERDAVVQEVIKLLIDSNLKELFRLLSENPLLKMPRRLLGRIILASIAAHDDATLCWALRHSALASLPPLQRVRISLSLARNKRPIQAFAILAADPSLLSNPDCVDLIATALTQISISQIAPAELRQQARDGLKKLFQVEDVGWTETSYGFRDQLPSPPLAPVGGIALAPGMTGAATAEILSTLKRRAIATSQSKPLARVRCYRDVFVDRWGCIWRRDGTILKHRAGVPKRPSALAMNDAPVHDAAVLATGNTNNLYHWFVGVFPTLAWLFETDTLTLPILIRDDSMPCHAESIRLAGGQDISVLQVGNCAFVRELFVASGRDQGLHTGGAARPMFERMIEAAGPPEPQMLGRSIFISRRDSTRRRPSDESALEQVFIDRGFEPVVLKGMPLDRRIRIMQGAAVVAGMHGAGLTMLFAARPRTRVYEILPWLPSSLYVRLGMAAISGQFGLRHRLWVEPWDALTDIWNPQIRPLAEDLDSFLGST